MAVLDFTPIQDLLGKHVCFVDSRKQTSFSHLEDIFQSYDFFTFGLVHGFTCYLEQSGDLIFEILVDDIFYSISDLKFLFVPITSAIITHSV